MQTKLAIATTLLSLTMLAAHSNPIQIREATEEQQRLCFALQEAKINLDNAKAAYHRISSAYSHQERAVKSLIKADKQKQAAEKASVKAISFKQNGYFADDTSGVGGAKLKGYK